MGLMSVFLWIAPLYLRLSLHGPYRYIAVTNIPIQEHVILALLVLSLAVGVTSVLAGRAVVPHEELLRSAGLWALLSFMLVLFCPVLGYFFYAHPAWSLMYLAEPEEILVPLWLVVVLSLPLALIGFFLARTWLAAERLWPTLALMTGSAALGFAILVFGQDRLLNVGTLEDFIAKKPMVPIGQTSLSYLVLAAGAVLGMGWMTMIWRLFVLGRTGEVIEVEVDAEREDTVNRPKKKKAAGQQAPGTRRKTRKSKVR